MAVRTNDAGLLALSGAGSQGQAGQTGRRGKIGIGAGEGFLQACRLPILEIVGAKTSNTLAQGATIRRAVASVGRTQPCPCGSGKKYKHCCLEKDKQRLHHSSEVAGVTAEELLANLDAHFFDTGDSEPDPITRTAEARPVKNSRRFAG